MGSDCFKPYWSRSVSKNSLTVSKQDRAVSSSKIQRRIHDLDKFLRLVYYTKPNEHIQLMSKQSCQRKCKKNSAKPL